MTLRPLPEFRLPKFNGDVTVEIPKKAMADWDRQVTALAGDDTITIFDLIGDYYDGGFSVARMAAALRAIGERPVTVQINSPGGIYDDGLAIYNLLRAHPARVTTQVIGMAASAASVIAMAGDEVQIGRAAHFMIHNTQWVAIGDRHVMEDAVKHMAIFDQTAADLYAGQTGLPVEEIAAMMDAETFLSSSEAVEKGFADGYLAADPKRVENIAGAPKPLAYRVEDSLKKDGWSRSEIGTALRTLTSGKPGAATNAMPSAGETAVDDSTLSIALARLKLARA